MRRVVYAFGSVMLGAACEEDVIRPAEPLEVIASDAAGPPTPSVVVVVPAQGAEGAVPCEGSGLSVGTDVSLVCTTASPTGQAHRGGTVAVPAEFAPTIELLFAHHRDDLPSRDVLAHHSAAEESLQWAVKHHPLYGIRARATILLGYFDTSSSTALVLELSRTEPNGLLCAASFEAISLWPLSKRQRHAAVIEAGLGDPRPGVAAAAQAAALGISGLNGDAE
jgi:hypothetical protein